MPSRHLPGHLSSPPSLARKAPGCIREPFSSVTGCIATPKHLQPGEEMRPSQSRAVKNECRMNGAFSKRYGIFRYS